MYDYVHDWVRLCVWIISFKKREKQEIIESVCFPPASRLIWGWEIQWWGQKWSRTKIYGPNLDWNENLGHFWPFLDFFGHFYLSEWVKMQTQALFLFPFVFCLWLIKEASPLQLFWGILNGSLSTKRLAVSMFKQKVKKMHSGPGWVHKSLS